MLLIGTAAGVYRAPIDSVDDATLVSDGERVLRRDGCEWQTIGAVSEKTHSIAVG